jgi:transcriptional regulator with XRE-family HTH domain
LTQANLAEALDVSVQWVSRVELGQNVTLFTLAKIAAVLEAPVMTLLDVPSEHKPSVRRGRPPRRR